MTLVFRYKKENVEGKFIARPKIPVTLINGNKAVEYIATVDSGSDYIFIPKDVADLLGLELEGDPEEVLGMEGTFKIRNSKLSLLVTRANRRHVLSNVPIIVGLGKAELQDVVLGRFGFFHAFEITFKEREEKIILKKYAEQLDLSKPVNK